MGSRSPSTAEPNDSPAFRGKKPAPRDLTCKLEMGRGKARIARTGAAVLTEDELRFRTGRTGKDGKDFSVHVRFEDVVELVLEASGVSLTVTPREGEPFTLHVGKHAPAWKTIMEVKTSRLDDLGIKPKTRVAVVGVPDPELVAEIDGRVPGASEVAPGVLGLDVIVAGAEHRADLARLGELARRLRRPGGVLLVVHPNDVRGVTLLDVGVAARAAGGLVESGSVEISRTHSALRLVAR